MLRLDPPFHQHSPGKAAQIIGMKKNHGMNGDPHSADGGRKKVVLSQAAQAKCQKSITNSSQLESVRKSLKRMIEILPSSNDAKIKRAFTRLPEEYRRILSRAVWQNDLLQKKKVSGIHYGKEQIVKNPSILGKTAACVIDARGGSLVKQLLHSVENRLSNERAANKNRSSQKTAVPLPRKAAVEAVKTSPKESPHVHEVPHSSFNDYLYKTRGASYKEGSTTFRVYAPNAQSVSLILTNHGKKGKSLGMAKGEDGTWEVRTKKAPPGTTYLYDVQDCNGGQKLRIDPFSYSLKPSLNKSSEVYSVVVDHTAYQWNDAEWLHNRSKENPLKKPLSIYEMQIKSWLKSQNNKTLSYRELAQPLIAYCKKMGFTHVEFYGLMEHIHQTARGYQVSNFFAPYRRLGSVEDFKYLVDQMHQNGIGVILDWIPAHYHHRHFETMYNFDGTDLFGSDPSNWGTMHLDYSKEEACRLMHASAHYWFKELHLDGLRVDAVSRVLGKRDKQKPCGVAFFQKLNQEVHKAYPGALMIAEETDGFPKLTKPVKEGGIGFDLKWGIGWSINSKRFFRSSYDQRLDEAQFKKITDFLHHIKHSEKIILSHSHDDSEKVSNTLMHMVSHPNTSDMQKFSDLRNFFAWQVLAPSRGHLIHMGDELGQCQSWFERLEKNQSAVEWEALKNSPLHESLQRCVKDLEWIYRTNASLWKSGEQGFQMMAADRKKGIVAYQRGSGTGPSEKEASRLIIVHNFSDKEYAAYDLPLSSGMKFKNLKRIFNSNSAKYGGRGEAVEPKADFVRSKAKTQAVRISIPALSTIVFQETS